VTVERRLAKLEGALSPRAATLLWLAEAHQFGSLPAYVKCLIDQPLSAAPLERVPAQARAAAVEVMRGQPREVVREAGRQAVGQAVFLVQLVLQLNVVAQDSIEVLGLRYAASFWEWRAMKAEMQLEAATPSRATRGKGDGRWTGWRAALEILIGNLYLAEETRAQIERRYLDGTSTLFADLTADWLRLRKEVERLAEMDDVVGLSGARSAGARRGRGRSPHRSAIHIHQLRAATTLDRAREEVAVLVDVARAAALEALGADDGAAAIAGRRLRAEPST
jgi:hypothetical protein